MTADGESRIGTSVENYRLVQELGKGSTSVVYLAQQLDDPQTVVAVKVLTFHDGAGMADRAAFRTRFLREARAASKLRHENILPVLSYGEMDDLTYMVMPIISGGTLAARLDGNKQALPLTEIAAYTNQLASALDFAHDQGIVHRDVKPSNVLVDEHDHIYLSDFGIARLFDTGTNTFTQDRVAALTQTGQVLGTPYYMAPEQIKGEPVGPATDVYELGVLVYQMVTGQVPYQGETPMAVAMQHLQDEPCPPTLLRSDLPPDAEKVILKALAKQPGERYARASMVARDFSAAVAPPALADPRNTSNDTRPASALLAEPGSPLAAYSSIRGVAPYHQMVGTTLGSYQLEQLIAVTDMGPIFRARSDAGGPPHRLRVLATRSDQPVESRSIFLGRFQQVAHQLADLQHPYILALQDYGSARGMPYLVTANVTGPSLTERIAQTGQMDLMVAGRYLDQMAAALEYGHEHGVLHRNLTPDCVYMQGSRDLVVADFEVRRMFEQSGASPSRSSLYFTSEACAPEQLLGKPVDTFTDTYALGAVVYQMLTGHPVFTGSTRDDIAQQHLHSPVPPLRRWRAGMPPGLENVLMRALAKEPEQRYRRPADLSNAYRQLVGAASSSQLAALSGDVGGLATSSPAPSASPVAGLSPRPEAPLSSAETLAASPAPPLDSAHAAAVPVVPMISPPAPAPATPAPVAARPAEPSPIPVAEPTPVAPLSTPAPVAPPVILASAAQPPVTPDPAPVMPVPVMPPPGGERPMPQEGGSGRPPDGPSPWQRLMASPVARNSLFGLVLLALIGGTIFAFSQSSSRKTTTPPPAAASEPNIAFFDSNPSQSGASDALKITIPSLPALKAGDRYVAWVQDAHSEKITPLGTLTQQDGVWHLDYNTDGKSGSLGTLLNPNYVFQITDEKDVGPLPVGPVVREAKFAPLSLQHIRHLLVSYPLVPNQAGILVGAGSQLRILLDQTVSIKTYQQRGFQTSMKCEAQSVLDILEGSKGASYKPLSDFCTRSAGIVQVGDGLGLLGKDGYLAEASDHATLAAQASDATAFTREHAGHVVIASQDMNDWLTTVDQEAKLVVSAGDASKVDDMIALVKRTITGQDVDGDESIDPVKKEAGFDLSYAHSLRLAGLTFATPSK